jgi:uncharacterized membrane protein
LPSRSTEPSERKPPANKVKGSHVVEEHVDVGVPRQVAYDQWTQYRELAAYSKRESAEQQGEDRVSFTSTIGPSTRRWNAEIVEQVPQKRIAWRSISGPRHLGAVTFHELDDRLTRVMVSMEYHPRGPFEVIGNFFRMQRRRVRKNLRLFKHFVELRGEATGEGQGEVRGDGLKEETDLRIAGAADGGGDGNGRRSPVRLSGPQSRRGDRSAAGRRAS